MRRKKTIHYYLTVALSIAMPSHKVQATFSVGTLFVSEFGTTINNNLTIFILFLERWKKAVRIKSIAINVLKTTNVYFTSESTNFRFVHQQQHQQKRRERRSFTQPYGLH